MAIMGTIQFAGGVHAACTQLADHFTSVAVPQAKPLSPGEVLGCTSPVIEDKDALVFVADGRFHLEVQRESSICVLIMKGVSIPVQALLKIHPF